MAGAAPCDNVFIGDLPPAITQQEVETIFAGYGTIVQCRVMAPRGPGLQASALVRFGSVDEATWVVTSLNGNLAEGLEEPIVARYANAPGSRPGKDGGGKGAGGFWGKDGSGWQGAPATAHAPYVGKGAAAGGGSAPGDNVFIGDLPPHITQTDVESIFSGYGTIVQCRVNPSKGEGFKASALVRFSTADEAAWIVQSLHGNLAEGLEEPVIVRLANAPGGKGKDGGKGGGAPWQPSGMVAQAFNTPAAYTNVASHAAPSVPGQDAPNDNIFVGDLPPTVTQDLVATIFAAYGSIVQCRVLEPKGPGAKASALVRYSSVDEATWAVSSQNGNLAEGLEEPIIVRFAKPPRGKDGGKGGGYGAAIGAPMRAEPYGGKGAAAPTWGGSPAAFGGKGAGKAPAPSSARALHQAIKGAGLLGGGHVPNDCQVYVRNLPLDTTDLDLYRIFAPFGALASSGAKAMMNDDGSCKGFGFVDFIEPLSAQASVDALQNFTMPDGSTIGCSIKVSQKEGKGGKAGKGF